MPAPPSAVARASRAEAFARGLRGALLESDTGYRLATLLLVLLLGLPIVTRYPINHDVGAHLELTHRMLSGERLYSSIVEPNPPLILWLYVPVVLASRLTGIADVALVNGWLLLGVLACAWAAARLLHRVALPGDAAERRLYPWMLLWLFTAGAGYEFGQRDPMAVLLTFPWAVAAAGRASGRRVAASDELLAGALAAVGFALKPYFVAPWLLVEGYLALVRGDRRALVRPANLVIMAAVGAYGAWVAFGTDYLANLRVVRFSYAGYGASLRDVVAQSDPALWAVAFALLLFVRAPRGDRELRVVLGLLLAGFLAAGVAQMKGWPYHMLPGRSLARLAIAATLLGLARFPAAFRNLARLPAAGLAAAAAILLLGGSAVGAARGLFEPEPTAAYVRELATVTARLAEGRNVAIVTSSAFPALPVLNYAGVHNVLTLGTWPLPTLYAGVRTGRDGRVPYRPLAEMVPAERFVVDRFVADLARARPELLIFDRRVGQQAFGDVPFDYEAYFSQDPRFRSLLASEYVPALEAGGFRFYKRRPGAPR